jgi:hypothetical protein
VSVLGEEELLRTGLETIGKPTQEFLEKVSGEPGSVIGGILGDRLRARQYRNAIKRAEKAREFAATHGIDPREVPLNVLFPIFEQGSLEEEEEEEEEESMVDRWAALLANAATDLDAIPAAFPPILSQLAPNEALALQLLADAYETNVSGWGENDLAQLLGVDVPDDFSAANVQNLSGSVSVGTRLENCDRGSVSLKSLRCRNTTGS